MPFDNLSFGHVDPDTRTLRAAMTVPPPPGRLWQIDQTIRQLKQHGIWQKLDVLWMLAAHDAQAARLNWKNPASFALTAVNSPTFTADRGYAGNGTTSYLNTGWAPSTNGVNYTLNSAAHGVYINGGADTADGTMVQFGANDASNGSNMIIRGTADVLRGRVNQAGAASFSGTVSTRQGLTVFDRSSSSLTTAYRNGASTGTYADASGARGAQAFLIGALGTTGSPSNYSSNRLALAFAAASLSAAEHAALYRIPQSFLASMGAAV